MYWAPLDDPAGLVLTRPLAGRLGWLLLVGIREDPCWRSVIISMGWAPPGMPWLTLCCCCCSHRVRRTASCHFRHRMAHLRRRQRRKGEIKSLFNLKWNIYVNQISHLFMDLFTEWQEEAYLHSVVIYMYTRSCGWVEFWVGSKTYLQTEERCLIWSDGKLEKEICNQTNCSRVHNGPDLQRFLFSSPKQNWDHSGGSLVVGWVI